MVGCVIIMRRLSGLRGCEASTTARKLSPSSSLSLGLNSYLRMQNSPFLPFDQMQPLIRFRKMFNIMVVWKQHYVEHQIVFDKTSMSFCCFPFHGSMWQPCIFLVDQQNHVIPNSYSASGSSALLIARSSFTLFGYFLVWPQNGLWIVLSGLRSALNLCFTNRIPRSAVQHASVSAVLGAIHRIVVKSIEPHFSGPVCAAKNSAILLNSVYQTSHQRGPSINSTISLVQYITCTI